MSYEFYVNIEGSTGNKWKGECLRQKKESSIPGFYFGSSVVSPRDAASGQPTGKRRHDPVILRKKVGAATPLFSKALTTNEVLKSVVFEFVRTDEKGTELVFFLVTLKGATVSTQKLYLPEVSGDNHHLELSEEIAFTFQSIEWNHKEAKTMHTDDWKA